MEQQALRFDPPRARRRDPRTSHIAADRFKASGAQNAHHRLIVQAIRARPGMTYTQIAEATGIEKHAVARRLKELEPESIRRGEPTTDGRPMMTWFPVQA